MRDQTRRGVSESPICRPLLQGAFVFGMLSKKQHTILPLVTGLRLPSTDWLNHMTGLTLIGPVFISFKCHNFFKANVTQRNSRAS